MKLHMPILIGFALCVAGCAEKEQPATEQIPEMEEVTEAVEAVAEEAVTDEAVLNELDVTPEKLEEWRNAGFLDHMHMHAEQLDELNFALADGDLEKAMTPAYWLSGHKTVRGLPEELTPYLEGMRAAARAVEAAEDLETARTAAAEIGVHCVACHTASGVILEE